MQSDRVFHDFDDIKKKTIDHAKSLPNKEELSQLIPYLGMCDISQVYPYDTHANIYISNMDCLRAVSLLPNGVVLNLASDFRPGGGWGHSIAQEESIFYRSSACLSLDIRKCGRLYPLEGKILYTPVLHVFRDINYVKLIRSDCFNTSMISCAGIRRPVLIDGHMNENDTRELYNRVEMILRCALAHGHRNIVLGALGCGAFRCPIPDVVKVFKYMTNKYIMYFQKIVFAILEDRNGTYSKFDAEWKRKVID